MFLLFKRLFDILLAISLIIALFPIYLIIALIIFIQDFGTPIFKQMRVGKGGKEFMFYKFRSMPLKTPNVESHQKDKLKITPFGKFIRRTNLDELPQFWSVFIGDMSLVGPRPISIMHYERDLTQGNISRKILKGGLLGLGHINKGTLQMGDPQFEYEYIDNYIKYSNWDLIKLDFKIILRGVKLISQGGGF